MNNFETYSKGVLEKSSGWEKSNLDSLKYILLHLDTARKALEKFQEIEKIVFVLFGSHD